MDMEYPPDFPAPAEKAWTEAAPKALRRRRFDLYEVRRTIRELATLGLLGIGGYAVLMAGMWLQAHQ